MLGEGYCPFVYKKQECFTLRMLPFPLHPLTSICIYFHLCLSSIPHHEFLKPIWECCRLGSLFECPSTVSSPSHHLLIALQSAAALPTGQFRWSAVSFHHGHPPSLPLKDEGTVSLTSVPPKHSSHPRDLWFSSMGQSVGAPTLQTRRGNISELADSLCWVANLDRDIQACLIRNTFIHQCFQPAGISEDWYGSSCLFIHSSVVTEKRNLLVSCCRVIMNRCQRSSSHR